jgi:hypothetical protein
MKGKVEMRKNFSSIMFLSFVWLFSLSACNLGAQTTPNVVDDVPVDASVAEVPSEPTAPAVEHIMVPGELPATHSGRAGDHDSSTTADENRAPAGDRFSFGRYERPFNADTMDVYHPNIDIQITEFYQDDTWLYGVITLKDDGSGRSLSGKYGFEIDLNLDGGGDWLIMAVNPSSTEWNTDGVQVWFDENNDVGGSAKVVTDNLPFSGDGFEKKMFGDGDGDDPDMAFARISPDDPYTVQIAVKRTILGGSTAFMVGMWAGNDLFDPALFDHNDRFTHDEAGSSLVELEFFYPIKEVFELDNACRIAIGFNPTGGEPGVCPVASSPGDPGDPDDPPGLTCPPPTIVFCNSDGSCYCLGPEG